MQKIILITGFAFFIWGIAIVSCKKDNSKQAIVDLDRRPVAKAGDLVRVELVSCSDRTGSAELDGSGSFDPDSNIVSYRWRKISGLPGFILSNAESPVATLENISFGKYTFELTVTDEEGLSATDRVDVITTIKEYNLDFTYQGAFNFIDNYHYVDFYYDEYYDFTDISGKVNFSPFGEFNFQISEYSDSADLADSYSAVFHFYKDNFNDNYISGSCSVNFKKLIKDGGGPFNGTIDITGGSVQVCGLATNLPPISISGNLYIASRTVTLRIQGKVNF